MHGKRPFPWPEHLPPLSFHEEPEQRVLRITWCKQVPVSASIHTQDRRMGLRLETLLRVGSGIAALLRRRHHSGSLTIQLHDEEPSIPCIRFDACVDDCKDRSQPLIPDPYCLMSGGYRLLREKMHQTPLPPWQERLPVAFWRGATTGSHQIDLTNLDRNCRYQLSRHSLCWPGRLDARLNRIVQCRDEVAENQVRQRLQHEQLLGPLCTARRTSRMANRHRWKRQLVGSSLETALGQLRSTGEQPQNAVVPSPTPTLGAFSTGAADLSDLEAKLDWCFSHRRDCAAIAEEGKALALQVVNEIEDDLIRAGVLYAQAWI